jgi:hypothetical protein
MSTQDDRAQKIIEWLKHMQGWKDSGQSLAAYAKAQGLAVWAMYHWRGVLIREGHWHQESKPEASAKSRNRSPLALRFAKVAVTELCQPMPVTVRLHLANGRRAEIDLMGMEQLEATIAALERRP